MKVQSGTNEKNKQQLYPFTIGGVKTLAFVIQTRDTPKSA